MQYTYQSSLALQEAVVAHLEVRTALH